MAARCGMSEREFWQSTPRFFFARYKAWIEDRNGWEQARFIAFHTMKTIDAKRQIRSVRDIAQFPWEEQEKPVFDDISQEEMRKFSNDADEHLKSHNPTLWATIVAARNNGNN